MDKRLTHSPEHYRERLSAYAVHTIDIDTPVGVFRQKANKQEDITVIDEGTGVFRVYISYRPLLRLGTSPSIMNPDMKKDALYVVTITSEKVITKVQYNKLVAYCKIGFFILCMITVSILVSNKSLLLSLSILLFIPILFLMERANKNWLQTLLIKFLNNL